MDVVWQRIAACQQLSCHYRKARTFPTPISVTQYLLRGAPQIRDEFQPLQNHSYGNIKSLFLLQHLPVFSVEVPSLTGLFHALTVIPRSYLKTQIICSFPVTQ
jgi:hypothetical protein